MKARNKPVIIEAIIFTGWNAGDCFEFTGIETDKIDNGLPYDEIAIETLEGVMKASIDDYIIKGVNGEFCPCKPDVLEKTYDIVGDE